MKSKILELLAVGLLVGPIGAQGANVVVGDTEWRQLTDTTNLSWDQVATICNPTTGVCSGSVGAVSFDGWTWAARADVRTLFEALIQPSTQNFLFDSSNYTAPNNSDPDIDAAISAEAFTATAVNINQETVYGLTRELYDATRAYGSALVDNTTIPSPDFAQLASVNSRSTPSVFQGFWLFRSVPEPGSLALLGLGLLGLGVTRRRKLN